ncbi:MAG: mechanosensitive ion channel family protein [Alphaproteobacteria bacterium]|nr:mechanosensitive ion channel family protein [Alphaproteobacteria bacterium]
MFRFAPGVRPLALVLLLAFTALAAAQQQAPLVGIDPIRASLDQIETTARRSADMRALADQSEQLNPLRDTLRAKLADLAPRLADLDARLKSLGPAPADNAPPESAAVTAERTRIAQQRAEIDAAIKQVQVLQTRAEQLANLLSERRRSAYSEALFQRSPNVLDPRFWVDVAAALPDTIERLVRLTQDTAVNAREQGGTARMLSAGLTLVGLMIFLIGLARWWRRVGLIARAGARYGKAFAALIVFLRLALALPLTVLVVAILLDQFELVSRDHVRVLTGLLIGTAVAALARAAAISVLAPDDRQRRLLERDDATAQWLAAHLIWGGRLFGAFIVLRTLNRAIVAPEPIDVALRMLFALAIGALLVHLLIGRREGETEAAQAQRIPGMRLLTWIIIATLAAALLSGYAGLAAFEAERVVFTVALAGTLYLLLIVTNAVIDRITSAESAGGRVLARQLGIDARRLALFGRITSGIVRAVFVLIVLALALGRWEIAAADLFDALRGASLGIRIGDFTISFGALFGAILLFLIIAGLTKLIQRWLEREVLPQSAIEPSLQLSIVTVFGYIGTIVALLAALSEIGIDPQKIALVAGALSVGIGFGLQSIVSNFVSGLILLAERPIRIGDQIVVKGEEGFVRRISVRATEIETFDKASVLVPNSELITGVVKNRTHANLLGRVNIRLTVSYASDPDKVMAILRARVDAHPDVLKQPPPAIQLTEFGPTAIAFDVFCIVPNLGDGGRIKSEIQVAILREFRAGGIEMTAPQDVRLIGGQAGGKAS